MRTTLLVTLLVTLLGCGEAPPPAPAPTTTAVEPAAVEPAAVEPAAVEPAIEPAAVEPAAGEPAPVAADAERAAAIAEAEAFVRAQGYADTPATVTGDEIVHEGIEGSLEDRRGSLDPVALHAGGANGEWNVIFRYAHPLHEDRGRMLQLRPGQRPSFVHQDLIISAFLP